jgi:hypothetical protein
MVNKKRKEKKSPLHKRRLRWCNGLGVYEKERIDGWFDGLLGWYTRSLQLCSSRALSFVGCKDGRYACLVCYRIDLPEDLLVLYMFVWSMMMVWLWMCGWVAEV